MSKFPDKPWDWTAAISRNKFMKHSHLIRRIKRKLLIHLLCVSAFNYVEIKYRPGNS